MVRTLERDAGGLTAANPYTGTTQPITNYLADRTEAAILHMVNADPARTPTFTMFARPDYFLSTGAANCTQPCVSVNPGFAYNHGDYAAEIDTNYVGFAGPGVKNLGLDGSAAECGPELGRAGQRPGHRPRQPHQGHLGRRDRHPAHHDVPARAYATTTSTTAGSSPRS